MMTLIEALQIENVSLTKSGFKANMNLGQFHEQPQGFVNGGAVLAFAEIVAGYASNLLEKGKYGAVGQSIAGNHMKTLKAERKLYAKGELLHRGEKTHVWSVRMEDCKGNLTSIITITNVLI